MEDGISWCVDLLRPATAVTLLRGPSKQRGAFLHGTVDFQREGVIMGVIIDKTRRPPTPFLSPIPPSHTGRPVDLKPISSSAKAWRCVARDRPLLLTGESGSAGPGHEIGPEARAALFNGRR